jgi:acyl-CoA thioesterase-1
MGPFRIICGLALATGVACGGRTPDASGQSSTPKTAGGAPIILCLGTSLTAGDGLVPEQAYPALLQARIDAERLRYRVVNAGVSGETSAGALSRIDWLLKRQVAVLVLETGANDGLRGHDPEAMRANIQAILDRVARETPPPRVLLVGMATLTNYGADYARRYRSVFPELAERNGAGLLPFLLEGVAGVPELNLPDGLHPNAEGQRRVAENVWKALRPML